MKPLHKQPIDLFLDQLGSSNAVPGGGVAAALCAALGTALLEMVLRINQRRIQRSGKKIPGFQTRELQNAVKIRRRLQALMPLDAQAFRKISAMYKKSKNSAGYQKALKNGAGAPEEICRLASEAAFLAAKQKNGTSRWLMSDLKESAVLLRAGFQSARLNVLINTNLLKDRRYAAAVTKRLALYEKKLRRSHV